MFKAGDIVISKAGHDAGRAFVVIEPVGQDFAIVCDGKYRPLINPKTKRNKHLSFLLSCDSLAKLIEDGKLTDAHIIHNLKLIKPIREEQLS